jgi:TonB family protein
VRIGGNVPPPTKVRTVDPVYPEAARTAEVSGVVILEAVIGVDGTVIDVEVRRSIPALDDAALVAVRQWEYTPTVIDDVPVPVLMNVTIHFRLATDDEDDDDNDTAAEPQPQDAGSTRTTPSRAARSQEPVRIGGDVPPPTKVRDVDPVYPAAALEARVSGVVILEAVIGVDGTVIDVEVRRSIPALDDAALVAVRQWEYTPTVIDDVPVPVVMNVTIHFRLATDDEDDDDNDTTAEPQRQDAGQTPSRLSPQAARVLDLTVEHRVARVLDSSGVDGVLADISRLGEDSASPDAVPGDDVIREHFTALFEQATMTDAQAAHVLTQAGDQIASDYELSLLLMQQRRRAEGGPPVRDAYLAATSRIESDHEQRLVVTELIANGQVGSELLRAFLETATDIQSDEERARLLIDVAEMQDLGDATRNGYFELVDEMQSNTERAGVLTALATRATDTGTLTALLQSSARLNSDAHKSRVLQTVVARRLEDPIRGPFFRAAGTIHSDHEKRRTLSEVADLDAPSVQTLADTLRLAAEIDNDHELASLLVRIADQHPLGGELRNAYLTAADTIASSFEQRQAMAALASQ